MRRDVATHGLGGIKPPKGRLSPPPLQIKPSPFNKWVNDGMRPVKEGEKGGGKM